MSRVDSPLERRGLRRLCSCSMAASPRDIVVIVNFSAGHGNGDLSRGISEAFRANGVQIRIVEMRSGDDVPALAAAAVIGPETILVAAGGGRTGGGGGGGAGGPGWG